MTQNLMLTPNQIEAFQHFTGPALTLAIPGSGKTTVLIQRLLYLVSQHGVNPSEILTLTFSKASADDMAQRYDKISSNMPKHPFQFMTIHKFAYGILKQYLKKTGLNLQLLDDNTKRFFILNTIYKKYYQVAMTDDDYELLTNHIGLITNLKLEKKDFADYDFQFNQIFEIVEDYNIYKKKHHFFDFDDMILYAYKILVSNPKALTFYQNKFPFIQIDEAQDTSKLQFEFIELLMGASKNLFIVADDDQSIYGFRGAFPDYLLNYKVRFPEARLYYLIDNFRSDANIVRTADALIKNNEKRFDKLMSPWHGATLKPSFFCFDDLIKRNQYLIKDIKDTDMQCAVLYRNKISALSILHLLEKNNIEYFIKDSPKPELSHWILEDMLAFFHLAFIPQDLESFSRIAFKMNGYISREMLNYVRENIRGKTVFQTLVDIPFLEDYQTRTQEKLMDQFEQLKWLRPYDAIAFIESELGYLDYIRQNATRLGISMNYARTRLDAYKGIAKDLKSGFDFIERISALKEHLDLQQTGMKRAQVILSTIHGAKGLEFDKVYMIDVNDQIFPGLKAQNKNALEEERRLFYVGLTRAKKEFELLHTRFLNGDYNKNSLFIEEFLIQDFTYDGFDQIAGKSPIS